jgi:predicted ArsR family transcriptional regulator
MGRLELVERKETILLFLKQRGEASLAEIATHLEMTKQGALRHLDALVAEGMVAAGSAAREAPRPGRPERRYSLTAEALERFPHAHRELASELVSFMGAEQLSRFFEARAARLEAEYAARLAGLSPDQRVAELARLATEHGHMAEVVRMPDGSLAIRQCNCPIQDVAAQSGHPCRQEQDMYRRLLGAEVVRETWMGESSPACTYVVKATDKERGVKGIG